MTLPSYEFSFPAEAAGLSVSVLDPNATEVATGTLGSEPNESGVLVFATTLDPGNYVATAEFSTAGVVNSQPAWWRIYPDRLESTGAASGGGVGAAETAYFVATGPADVTDSGGAAGSLTFVADDRHAALPDWATLVSGDIVLTDEAATVAWSFNGVYDFDFSATTPPTASGSVTAGFFATFDGTNPDLTNGHTAGDGQNSQTSAVARGGGLGVFANISITGFPSAEDGGDITDGTATPRAALTITRIAQAAVLPA